MTALAAAQGCAGRGVRGMARRRSSSSTICASRRTGASSSLSARSEVPDRPKRGAVGVHEQQMTLVSGDEDARVGQATAEQNGVGGRHERVVIAGDDEHWVVAAVQQGQPRPLGCAEDLSEVAARAGQPGRYRRSPTRGRRTGGPGHDNSVLHRSQDVASPRVLQVDGHPPRLPRWGTQPCSRPATRWEDGRRGRGPGPGRRAAMRTQGTSGSTGSAIDIPVDAARPPWPGSRARLSGSRIRAVPSDRRHEAERLPEIRASGGGQRSINGRRRPDRPDPSSRARRRVPASARPAAVKG